MGANTTLVAGCLVLSLAVAVNAMPAARSADAGGTGGSPTASTAPHRILLVDADLGPIVIPAVAFGPDDTLRLREVAGARVTIRVTPVDERGDPIDGGRLIGLRAGETRTLRLSDAFPAEDLADADLVVEALGGAGRAAARVVGAGEPEPTEAEDVAALQAPAGARRLRRKVQVLQFSTMDLIDQAVTAGTLDPETALVYKAFALFGDARLPSQFQGNDSARADSLELDEIRAAAPTMSSANQALVQPFLVPPAYQGSWAAQAVSGSVHGLDAPPPCSIFATNWSWLESAHGFVRVWFRSDLPSEATAAQSIIDAVEGTIWPKFIGLMVGHAPLADDGESCNGGSGTLDMYITDLPPKYAGMCCAYHPGGAPTPAYILLDHAADLATVAHELFHAFQDSYQRLAGLTDQRYDWWTEASAEWSEDYVYHGGPGTDERHSDASAFLRTPELPLDQVDTATNRHYGAYLLPFYVYNKTGSAAFVAQSWANCAGQPALEALGAALPGGFAAIWPEFALHDWNAKPVDQYFQWDRLLWQARPSGGTVVSVDVGGGLDSELQLKVDLPRVSATYKSFNFTDASVRSVAFWNGASFDLEKLTVPIVGPFWNPTQASDSARKGVKVQALVKVSGSDWTIEDWTDRPYVEYCRDLTAERLERLVLIISNSEYSDRNRRVTPPGLAPVFWASRMGCWQWKGTATYTLPGAGGTQTDIAQVTWTRLDAQPDPARVTYQATGSVTVTMSGDCSGGGTVPITTTVNALDTYNFTPADSAARGSYKGQGLETAMVPITCKGMAGKTVVGPWFQILPPQPPQFPSYVVSNDGATMSATYVLSGITWHWELHAQSQ
ncbi:MAG TPA: hypothetical protein VMT19_01090 [Thermoanaerobaculaceae bacterium]|nr:hypothetical protein [Thermoanaerobaculaceae bacterium]